MAHQHGVGLGPVLQKQICYNALEYNTTSYSVLTNQQLEEPHWSFKTGDRFKQMDLAKLGWKVEPVLEAKSTVTHLLLDPNPSITEGGCVARAPTLACRCSRTWQLCNF